MALRQGKATEGTEVAYLLSDNLGSATITADLVNGNKLTGMGYTPWGEERYVNCLCQRHAQHDGSPVDPALWNDWMVAMGRVIGEQTLAH